MAKSVTKAIGAKSTINTSIKWMKASMVYRCVPPKNAQLWKNTMKK